MTDLKGFESDILKLLKEGKSQFKVPQSSFNSFMNL